jgi:hypothetical protein
MPDLLTPVARPTPGRDTVAAIRGRPLGWDGLALAVTVARAHPDWPADKVERRAAAMQACNVATNDDLAARLRRRRTA